MEVVVEKEEEKSPDLRALRFSAFLPEPLVTLRWILARRWSKSSGGGAGSSSEEEEEAEIR